jgi:Flp pilus assembly CpaE family ATPase
MFPCFILGSSYVRAEYLKKAAMATGQLLPVATENEIPEGVPPTRLFQGAHGEIALLDFAEPERAVECSRILRMKQQDLAVIAAGGPPMTEDEMGEAGVIARIDFPIEEQQILGAIDKSVHILRPSIEEKLILFLPSKAGSGSSTVLLHTATALATQFKKRVLVLESDLRSGVLSVMLNANVHHGLAQALENVRDLDLLTINQIIQRADGVDWLFATPDKASPLPEWLDYFLLLDKVRGYYDYILADLPELVNFATKELVRRARLVCIVTTPEVLPLRLAKQRCAELERWGVSKERTVVLVNRWHQEDLAPDDLTEHLGRPIGQVFPNDYKTLRAAVLNGKPAPLGSEFSRAVTTFAEQLTGEKAPEIPRPTGLRSLLKF